MNSNRIPSLVKVFVLSGDRIVGQALELLLRSANYSVKFLTKSALEEPGSLDGAHVLLLGPGLDRERREALLRRIESMTASAEISILELVADTEAAQVGSGRLVWPCRTEDLKRQIKAALHAKSEAGQEPL